MGQIARNVSIRNHGGMEKMVVPFIEKSFELSGRVVDSSTGEVVGFARVAMKGSGNGTTVDTQGAFKLDGKVKSSAVAVRITAIGYEAAEIEIAVPVNDFKVGDEIFYLKRKPVDLETVTMLSGTSDLSEVIVGGFSMDVSIKRRRLYELPKRLTTLITDSVRISPDPVTRGNDFKVSLKLKQAGGHTIQLIDPGGRIVFQKPFNIVLKAYVTELHCARTWSTGVYSLRVIGPGHQLAGLARLLIQ